MTASLTAEGEPGGVVLYLFWHLRFLSNEDWRLSCAETDLLQSYSRKQLGVQRKWLKVWPFDGKPHLQPEAVLKENKPQVLWLLSFARNQGHCPLFGFLFPYTALSLKTFLVSSSFALRLIHSVWKVAERDPLPSSFFCHRWRWNWFCWWVILFLIYK